MATTKRYSIADARASLPSIIDRVEAGEEIEITRHGRPVAVMIAVGELQRLRADRPRFADAYQRFLAEHSLEELDVDKAFFDALRDRGVGRKVVL
jgi:prevent-host-death family protein